ncbi:MAG: PD40 domain-containing protein, partial [Anaerolineae bacterium]|nr:PD40 domain-containing protein [Anaerolineae bacterium]
MQKFLRYSTAMFFAALLVFGIASTNAQSVNDELFAFHEGDLWAWMPGESPEQLTTWGYNGGPIISPDGSQIAYRSVASEAVAEIEGAGQGITYAGDAPSNIYIMQVSTRNFERIAAQSAIRVFRSSPVWSPDGTRLAWSEMRGDYLPSADVVIYDTRDGSTRTVASIEMGYGDGGLVMPILQWGDGGIARLLYTFDRVGEGGQLSPSLYWDIVDPDQGTSLR